VSALASAVGLTGESVRFRRLDDVRGTWMDDPDFDPALGEQ
jgi:hypothetical protein